MSPQPPEQNALSENLTSFDNTAEEVKPNEPLNSIALCLSGGGFRAASFSLGVISYLHRIHYKDRPLLESVKFITSTSGGSITNCYYSSCVYKKIPFETFYGTLRNRMNGEVLLKEVFSILNDKTKWTEQGILIDDQTKKKTFVKKERNLINAFAKAYDKLLLDGSTLSTITNTPQEELPHLEEVAFNATEFNNGMAFYFQANGHQHYVRYHGNEYLKFNDSSIASRLKISDLVASSSCFPGGLEPLRYPNDFVHAGNTDVNAMLKGVTYSHNDPGAKCSIQNKPFALMDGGIVDNMGLNCVLKTDRARVKAGKGHFDLILSCDVTSYFNDPLDDEAKPVKGWYKQFTLQGFINVFKIAPLFFIACLILILKPFYPVVGYLILLPSLLFSIIYFIGFFKLRKAKKKGGTFKLAVSYLPYFLRLPLKDLIPMLSRRVSSVAKLVGDLFLKQIRRGQYDLLFQTPTMKDRAIACLVHEFSTAHQVRRLANLESRDSEWWGTLKAILTPGSIMQKLVDEARTMGTTLWFDDQDLSKRDKLIATGQLTVCYSLIKHICRLEVLDDRHRQDGRLQELKGKLLEDWDLFQIDPLFIVENPTITTKKKESI